MINLPELSKLNFEQLSTDRYAFIFAMGFEDRALTIPKRIAMYSQINTIIGISYSAGSAKGQNKETEAKSLFSNSGKKIIGLKYSIKTAHDFEYHVKSLCKSALKDITEVVIDISAMSKFLILVLIVSLLNAGKRIRIVFTSATEYAPSFDDYQKVLSKVGEQRITSFAGQPSSGISAILRSVCLSSSRMQGQPVCAVAFTSFNEELIRHSVGTLNPHRLILINGIPPNPDFFWRAEATQNIHQKLINEYSEENPTDINTGLLLRSVSTLNYQETLNHLLKIRESYSTYERIIYFATGSKMQAVALALLKSAFSDVHIEYPTPDSYYFKEYSKGEGDIWSFWIDSSIIETIKNYQK